MGQPAPPSQRVGRLVGGIPGLNVSAGCWLVNERKESPV